MKLCLTGTDIPMLLPALLADLLFAGKEKDAEIRVEEKNPAMAELMEGYGREILRKAGLGGSLRASGDRDALLRGADCVIYAGDPQAASRFLVDRGALESGENEEESGEKDSARGDSPLEPLVHAENLGLTDQARVNGGIEGLLHAMRAGQAVLELCDAMERCCPEALVINLGQPMARITEIFLRRGFRCFGMGRTPLKGANGLDNLAGRLKIRLEDQDWEIAGLPGFSFLWKLTDRQSRKDWLPRLKKAARADELGRLTHRWLDWWDALAVGDVTDHAEFLPAQPDYIPDANPEFGETVERRKERILYMNTVREKGADSRDGAMAQLLLLSKAPPVRPVRLALAVLRKEDGIFPAVTRRNRREMPQLPPEAVVETSLHLSAGQPADQEIRVSDALSETMCEIDAANRCAARAAMGDREAVREYVETDPALGGLDRLYCLDVVNRLIEIHQDVLPLYREE